MERARERMTSNDIAGNAELRMKGLDPPLKPQSRNMLDSPVMYTSTRNDWQECSHLVTSDTIEGKGLSSCVISMSGSEPPCTSPCSTNDTGLIVEELTQRNYRSPNLASVNSPNSSRQGGWQHLYQLASGSRSKGFRGDSVSVGKDQMMMSAREELMRMPSNMWRLKTLSGKQIDQAQKEVSALVWNGNSNIMPSNTLLIGGMQAKNLSTSSFSQAFVKKTLKGKEILYRNPEDPNGFGCAVASQNDEKVGDVNVEASNGLLNSRANNGQLSSHRTDGCSPESAHNSISLREWLKSKYHKVNKVESLHVFKQIVDLVDFSHSQGAALQDLRPSCFTLLPSNKVKYTGSSVKRGFRGVKHQNLSLKRPLGQDVHIYHGLVAKQQKLNDDMKFFSCETWKRSLDEIEFCVTGSLDRGCTAQDNSSYQCTSVATQQESISVIVQLEEKWYTSPEELSERGCTFSSNIYSLGVLLFELLCCFQSWEVHSAAMMDLRHRILPPNFLSENLKEAGFCLWLLHPDPSSRPTTRDILQSELIRESQECCCGGDDIISTDYEDAESELLLDFLVSLEEQKLKRASKLVDDIRCLEVDIKEVERRYLLSASSVSAWTHKEFPNAGELQNPISSCDLSRSPLISDMNEERLVRNIRQLENAYFSMRSQIQLTGSDAASRSDKDLLTSRERLFHLQNENKAPSINRKSDDHLGAFFEGLSKFARYRKFEVRGTIRSGDLLNSANVISSLSFNRDEDYLAAAGVSKKIKIFEFGSLFNDTVDIHYPVVEMPHTSKFSCVCWNNYIKSYLASTDYDGGVQIWDAGSGQIFSQYMEHQKRAWSVDFSQTDPTKFASGSDDCSVKLWSINESSSIGSIWNAANVCCVQFSAYSAHMLVFGSADYKINCYDLRHTKIPWCTLSGHGKAVSYVKFLDSDTLVSASTDNTLKLWDLNKVCSDGFSSSACGLTFTGHTNEKNFVGLSLLDGYIACGSETNEVYSYYRSFPMPITSHKFGSIDPISGHEIEDDNGQFVSSVCWRGKSNMVAAANSSGSIKLLQMV